MKRPGTTVIECVVAASVLMVAMGTVTTMAFRASRMWSEVGHQRIAMNELANQIERITDAAPDEIDQLISNLQPSQMAQENLDQPTITATRVRDSLGDRVDMELTWRSAYPVAPVRLTGWVTAPTREVSP
ncbi:hypothetical protein [Neorhodopirellula pilleata]|uniref:Type II secretion system protein n=1 Tax=Neorhodopirellula pilleata TaxID=2714738 RepID=A0A5C6A6K4_9BACT|nr:hypothetical protein [Neorhodopirellula pilleata]TWT95030.1 hypothetical protein Pla100_36090 [Neorhodopirellula pilleata]